MASIRANAEDEDSEEDADFDMKSEEDDGGEPSDESEAESGDAEVIDEQPKVRPSYLTHIHHIPLRLGPAYYVPSNQLEHPSIIIIIIPLSRCLARFMTLVLHIRDELTQSGMHASQVHCGDKAMFGVCYQCIE